MPLDRHLNGVGGMRFPARIITVLASVVALFGCSSASKGGASGPAPGEGTSAGGDQTWTNGKEVADITIPAGATVTIAPGATVTMAKGATIFVQGTLKARSRDQRSKLVGDGWVGIAVAPGGVVDLEGVDIANAQMAIDGEGGTATYAYGTISASGPFNVAQNAKLVVTHATVAGATSPSFIYGEITATFLDYDANQVEGIIGQGDGAVISIEDSKLHGQRSQDNDLVMSRALSKIHVAYTDLSNAHCNFHFDNVDSFDISFVSAHDGGYGMMLYGSSTTGAHTVKSSNIFKNYGRGAEEQTLNTVNGVITLSDGYWADNGGGPADNVRQFTGQIKVVNMSTTTPVEGVGPRGAVP